MSVDHASGEKMLHVLQHLFQHPDSQARARANIHRHTTMRTASPAETLSLSYLSSFFLELFDCSLVDTATLVDEVTGGSGLARIDVADNDDVDMCLLLRHGRLLDDWF